MLWSKLLILTWMETRVCRPARCTVFSGQRMWDLHEAQVGWGRWGQYLPLKNTEKSRNLGGKGRKDKELQDGVRGR